MQRTTQQTRDLIDWSRHQAAAFGREAFIGKHRLHEDGRFDDDNLLSLLEGYPRDRIQAFCSGTDPRRFREDWHRVEVGKASPDAILAAVAKGNLWINLQRIDLTAEVGSIVAGLYESLQETCHGFQPFDIQASLFISSPGALVYYHADANPNILWHIRGTKRVWVYPDRDVRLVPQALMEDIFAGAVDEIPFSEEFDKSATVFDLRPGDVASWPQNSPHRVCCLDGISVSLASIHKTPASERRRLIHLGNRYFRRVLKLPACSVVENGLVPDLKCLAYRICDRLRLVPRSIEPSDPEYSNRGYQEARFCIDETAPSGIRLV